MAFAKLSHLAGVELAPVKLTPQHTALCSGQPGQLNSWSTPPDLIWLCALTVLKLNLPGALGILLMGHACGSGEGSLVYSYGSAQH